MRQLPKAKMFVEFDEDEIIAYDYLSGYEEPDFESVGILNEISKEICNELMEVLEISIDEVVNVYGITIIEENNEPLILKQYNKQYEIDRENSVIYVSELDSNKKGIVVDVNSDIAQELESFYNIDLNLFGITTLKDETISMSL